MNINYLHAVQEMVSRYPENVDLLNWSRGTVIADKEAAPACGTSACIAGWTLALRDGAFNEDHYDTLSDEGIENIVSEASDALDIDSDQAGRLFVVFNWPKHLKNAYVAAPNARERSEVVNQRIDLFIDSLGAL